MEKGIIYMVISWNILLQVTSKNMNTLLIHLKGDAVVLKKIIVICLIAALALTLVGCGATKAKKEKFVVTDNMEVVEKQVEDLNGDGKTQKVILYGEKDDQGMPVWTLVEEEYEIVSLDSMEGAYTLADINLQDVDGQKGLEVLFYRYNTGSAGGQGLNIYKLDRGEWQEIFNVPNSFDMGKERFTMQYMGNYQVSFKDSETGLEHVIKLDPSRYAGNEEMLDGISTWVDPIAEYKLEDIDSDGVSEITTMQMVIGIAHADPIASLQTTYRVKDGSYQPEKISLVDISGMVLVEKAL